MQNYLAGKSIQDYQAAINRFCKDNQETTVYLAGEISHPGISDLDFLVVDDMPMVDSQVKPFLAGGNIIVMPSEQMINLNDFENFNLKHLQGKTYQIKNKHRLFDIVEIIEWLPERILKLESYKNNLNNITKLELMLTHKSINRSIRSVQAMTSEKFNIIEENDLRKLASFDKKEVVGKTLSEGYKAWQSFEDYLRQKKYFEGHASGRVQISQYYSFFDKFEILCIYFSMLSSIEKNKLSVELRKCCNIQGRYSMDSELQNFLANRWDNLSRIYQWFIFKKYKSGMIKYGWFL